MLVRLARSAERVTGILDVETERRRGPRFTTPSRPSLLTALNFCNRASSRRVGILHNAIVMAGYLLYSLTFSFFILFVGMLQPYPHPCPATVEIMLTYVFQSSTLPLSCSVAPSPAHPRLHLHPPPFLLSSRHRGRIYLRRL